MMIALAAAVLFQGAASAVMVNCHPGAFNQSLVAFSSDPVDPRISDEHCADMPGHGHDQHSSQDSSDKVCCGCEAVVKIKLDLPSPLATPLNVKTEFAATFISLLPSADLAPPFRPPIVA